MIKKILFPLFIFLCCQTGWSQLVCRFIVSDTAGCSPLIVHFTDSSSGNPTTWYWNFGNGDTSALQNPVEIFPDSGVYHITLIISNSTFTDSQSTDVRIYPTPSAGFITTDTFAQCPPYPVQFTASDSNSLYSVWNFDDGYGSRQLNPMHIYSYPGTYSVIHFVRNQFGCFTSETDSNLIHIKGPIVRFTASTDSGCLPLTVTFNTDTQSVEFLSFVTGDGSSLNDSLNITYTYTVAGIYHPVFTSIDSFGCDVTYSLHDSIQVFNCDSSGSGILTKLNPAFTIEPNPGSSYLRLTTNSIENFKITLTDVAGKSFITENVLSFEKVFNISSLPDGIYFLRLQNIETKQFAVKKVVIEH